jgi:hypothetical protein
MQVVRIHEVEHHQMLVGAVSLALRIPSYAWRRVLTGIYQIS